MFLDFVAPPFAQIGLSRDFRPAIKMAALDGVANTRKAGLAPSKRGVTHRIEAATEVYLPFLQDEQHVLAEASLVAHYAPRVVATKNIDRPHQHI
ncbi:hypothetical protein ABIB57_004971 [Devosia sp. UYZn731]|uniref:hypothetical protein n=1 Tax=Devosia sp. UYZn731 TaxID=3156345 RepID=UPI00339471E6